jgi:hypothetical protein
VASGTPASYLSNNMDNNFANKVTDIDIWNVSPIGRQWLRTQMNMCPSNDNYIILCKILWWYFEETGSALAGKREQKTFRQNKKCVYNSKYCYCKNTSAFCTSPWCITQLPYSSDRQIFTMTFLTDLMSHQFLSYTSATSGGKRRNHAHLHE